MKKIINIKSVYLATCIVPVEDEPTPFSCKTTLLLM